MPTVQSIDPTPNPNALKFVLDGPIVRTGSKSFANKDDAQAHPLAAKLFENDNVENVFFLDNFVTVTKKPEGVDWSELAENFRETINELATTAEEDTAASAPAPGSGDFGNLGDDDKLAQVNAVLDQYVRPALAGDGGGLEVLGLEEDGFTLRIRYQGACGSCPSAMAGTLMAIENMLKEEVDERIMVVPAMPV